MKHVLKFYKIPSCYIKILSENFSLAAYIVENDSGFKLTFQSCIVKNTYKISLALVWPICTHTIVGPEEQKVLKFCMLYAKDCWKRHCYNQT